MTSKKDNKKPTTIFIDPKVYKQLRILALELDKTVIECTEEAFKEYIQKHKKK